MRLFHPPILQAFIEWAHAFKLFQNLVVTCQARKIVCVRTYAQGALWRWVVKQHSHWAEAPPIRFAFSMRGYATKYYLTQESTRAMQCVECCCYWWKALEKENFKRNIFFGFLVALRHSSKIIGKSQWRDLPHLRWPKVVRSMNLPYFHQSSTIAICKILAKLETSVSHSDSHDYQLRRLSTRLANDAVPIWPWPWTSLAYVRRTAWSIGAIWRWVVTTILCYSGQFHSRDKALRPVTESRILQQFYAST